jgi:hypothetical protein
MCENTVHKGNNNDDDDDNNNNNNNNTENSHIGHCTHTSESANVKTQMSQRKK